MKVRTIILFNLIAMCLNANAQAREPSETQRQGTASSACLLLSELYAASSIMKECTARRTIHTSAMVTSYYQANITLPICRLQKPTSCCERT